MVPQTRDICRNTAFFFQSITVDLFASRLNNQMKCFVSGRPDPNAFAIDMFSLTWSDEVFFMFPPFSLISKILQKVEEDKTDAVLVAPVWPTQAWWPSLLQLVLGQCEATKDPVPTIRPGQNTSSTKNDPSSFSYIRKSQRSLGL